MAHSVVTGASGMIGTALVKRLVDEGGNVTALVRSASSALKDIAKSGKLRIAECSLSDYGNFMPEDDADIFYHLAWDKTTAGGREDALIQARNIQYSLDAVALAKRFGCSVFVGAGSQAEYGTSDAPLNANTPTNPSSCYGVAKYSAGRLTEAMCRQAGIRHNWVRILSVYGENDHSGSLIMYLISTLLEGGTPKLTECRQIWDYLYCGDAAAALVAIGNYGKDGKIYTLGSGKGRPLYEYAVDVKNYIDGNADLAFGAKEYYPHQPMYLVADIKELTADTGFVPATVFLEGIARTVDWQKRKVK